MDALADPAFRAAFSGAAFNRLPYLPALRTVIGRILGSRVFSYPVKVLRAVYPEAAVPARGRYSTRLAVSGPRAQLVSVPPGPSRLVRVHPGWRHWQPPRAVH